MDLTELQVLLRNVVGEVVSAKTIAGNSISLWFTVEPKAPTARRLWIDPPWRIETSTGVESSSYGFPMHMEDDELESQYDARFASACAKSDGLEGATVTTLSIDPRTSDLVVAFSNGKVLRNFAVDREDENWHFNDHGSQKRYGVSAQSISIESPEA